MLELLSPALTPEAVVAAVQCGADSIYIRFGADGGAGFSQSDFLKSVRYCRVRGCAVYAELTSVLLDGEMRAAAELARAAAEAGVSAMVAQDIGTARVIRAALPDMALHAGALLGVHNLAGAAAAAQLGFTRVQLSAEMGLEDIRFISANCPIETQVTVKDASCFSRVSECHFCAMTERISAMRGECPGPCREKYGLGGRMDDERPLHLKDVCLVRRLAELEEAGVKCARIGPVANTPELTALLTDIYSKCIKEKRQPSPGESDQLSFAFEHRPFTEGWLAGGEDMFGAYPPPEGDSKKVLVAARRLYEDSEARRVPVDFYVVAKPGEPIRAAALDGDGNRAAAESPAPGGAGEHVVTRRELDDAMHRTGGTPYACADVKVLADPLARAPEGAADGLRRALLKELTEKRSAPVLVSPRELPPLPMRGAQSEGAALIFQTSSASQLIPELAGLKPDYIYAPLSAIAEDAAVLAPFTENGCVPVAVLPPVVTDREAADVYSMLEKVAAFGVQQALVSDLGHVALCRRAGMAVRGDAGLSLSNSYAMGAAADAGLLSVTVPYEMTLEGIKELCKPVDTEMIIYGRVPVMLSEHCVIKRSAGRCSCSSPGRLTDNLGGVYPVLRAYGCRNLVLSASKLYMADKKEEYGRCGLWGARISFTTESARECVEVARSCMGLSDYRPNGLTRGAYYRGVV